MTRTLAILATSIFSVAATAQEDDRTDDIETLRASAENYVKAYNEKDAKAIAALYLENGEIHARGGEVVSGRQAIEARYEMLFTEGQSGQAALEVGKLRFVSPGIAVEEGTVHVTYDDEELKSFNYTAIHVEQDDGIWKTARVRDEPKAPNPAHDHLEDLSWILGDWMLESGETKTYLSFDWSDDGPFLDGRALTESAETLDTSATMRIARNPENSTYVSWLYDADGGFSVGEWIRKDDKSWLIRQRGVTSDGEKMRGTREIRVDANGQGFTWNSRDMTIDGELLPDRDLRVVKRPPSPGSASNE